MNKMINIINYIMADIMMIHFMIHLMIDIMIHIMIHIIIHIMIHIMIKIMIHLMTYIMTNIMTNIMVNVMTAWKKVHSHSGQLSFFWGGVLSSLGPSVYKQFVGFVYLGSPDFKSKYVA